MNKDTIIELLKDIKHQQALGTNRYGSEVFDTLNYALNKELISRTDYGNLMLSDKGADLLEGKLSWEAIKNDIPDSNNWESYDAHVDSYVARQKAAFLQQKKLTRNFLVAIGLLIMALIGLLVW